MDLFQIVFLSAMAVYTIGLVVLSAMRSPLSGLPFLIAIPVFLLWPITLPLSRPFLAFLKGLGNNKPSQ